MLDNTRTRVIRSQGLNERGVRELCMRLQNLKGLRALMVVQAVSQRRLALEAGYKSHAYMGRLLRGEVATLEPEAALRIARFLQVDVDYLFAPRPASGAARFAHHQRQDPPVPIPRSLAPSRDRHGASRGVGSPGSRIEGRHR